MPETLAIVTAVILERPLCIPCVAEKTGKTAPAARAAIRRLEGVLTVHRQEGRCHACGDTTSVVFVDRPKG